LNKPSVGELKSVAVGDAQLSIVVSLTVDWAINCAPAGDVDLLTRGLTDR
jgi:hypothetical protein